MMQNVFYAQFCFQIALHVNLQNAQRIIIKLL